MNKRRLALTARATAAAAAAGALTVGASSAPAGPAVQQITASGVGAVKLGKTYTALRQQRLVGRLRHGCELGGPNTRSASLAAPLRGSVDFTLSNPRKVNNISISGGARARGVGIGATLPIIRAAFPKAKIDHSTESTLGVTTVRIPPSDGGKLSFAVDTTTKKVTLIGVPFIAVCD